MIILTAVHKRPEVFEIFLKNIPVRFPLVVLGEKNDPCYPVWEQWIESRSIGSSIFIECKNVPLGAKWNAGLKVIKNLEHDYVFIAGSDDIFSKSFYSYYDTLDAHFVGCLDFYFYDYGKRRIKYCHGFQRDRRGETHGAGRMLHKNLLEKVNYQLWDDNLNKALDASMTSRLSELEFTSHVFRMSEKGIYGLDIKTEINIHSIREYQGIYLKEDEASEILKNFKW